MTPPNPRTVIAFLARALVTLVVIGLLAAQQERMAARVAATVARERAAYREKVARQEAEDAAWREGVRAKARRDAQEAIERFARETYAAHPEEMPRATGRRPHSAATSAQ